MKTEPHAVRWATRRVRNERQYTAWHYTEDASFTACGLPIMLAVETILPEVEEVEYVTCRRCLAILKRRKVKSD